MSDTGYDETPEQTSRMLNEFAQSGFVNHRRRLLRHDAGAHSRDRATPCVSCRRECCRSKRERGCLNRLGDRPAACPTRSRRRWRGVQAEALATLPARSRRGQKWSHSMSRVMRLAGLEPLTIGDDSLFVNVGERTNVTGSRAFAQSHPCRRFRRRGRGRALSRSQSGAQIDRRQHGRGDARLEGGDGALPEPDRRRARHRARAGDDRLVEVGRDRGGPEVRAGKPIVNSISLKEGEAEFLRQARLVRRYGAAVVVMAFDEKGQADTLERKTGICAAQLRSARRRASAFRAEDIVFDPNVFAIATGIDEHNNYAVDFIDGDALDQGAPAAREGLGRHFQRELQLPRQRAGARGDPHGVPLSRDPRRR